MPTSSRSDRAWVAAQLALMAATAATWFVDDGVTRLGFVPAALGAGLAGWALRALGRSLSPYPTPPRDAELVARGPFRFLRHPTYVGGVLFFAGLSLVFSRWGLVATGVLAVFWFFKARAEERRLSARFPGYAEYRRRTWF